MPHTMPAIRDGDPEVQAHEEGARGISMSCLGIMCGADDILLYIMLS